jgi:hypothetical protein
MNDSRRTALTAKMSREPISHTGFKLMTQRDRGILETTQLLSGSALT